ncbi:hypothetical protein [Elizabethkingia anophelis]|uniref:hypothetical protein n=1 Tax=Elizabethkingia anophelis TaxID=1117645 RepID=UPI001EE732AF|nr:hypothetical protein [Elizabethkingia anophelis]UKY84981.1 hypothetical protein KUF66_06030 [Elizabethkingia anophelis]UKY95607.1 hypothetical protein KUF67_06040 [Elizabethkingia anophelis]
MKTHHLILLTTFLFVTLFYNENMGLYMEYNLNQKGDYSLVIGKSLMADGSQKGKFSVQLK